MASLNGRTVHQWKHRFEVVNSEGDIEAQREAEIAVEDDRVAMAIGMKVLRPDVETFNNHLSFRNSSRRPWTVSNSTSSILMIKFSVLGMQLRPPYRGEQGRYN
jgi:hypothetical protein